MDLGSESEKSLVESSSNERLKCGEIFLQNQEIIIECMICDSALVFHSDDFIKHVEEHLVNPFVTPTINEEESELEEIHNAEEKEVESIQSFTCVLKSCPNSSQTKKELYIHILENHCLTLNIGDNYECAICEVKFKSRIPLIKHLSKVHGIILSLNFEITHDIFKCPQCKDEFKTNALLNFHLKKKHAKYFREILADEIIKLQKSMNFDNNFNKINESLDHSKSKKKPEVIADEHDSIINSLQSGEDSNGEISKMLIDDLTKNNTFACLIKSCQNCSQTRKELYHHILENHNLILVVDNHYQCAICDINYNQRTSLVRHLNKFHGIILNMKFKTEDGLFQCPQCFENFKINMILNSHLKKNHLDYFNTVLAMEIVKLQNSRNDLNTSLKKLTPNHNVKLKVCALKKLIVQLDNGLWKCLYCNETKDKRNNIRVHVRNHFDRKMCDICGQLMKTKKFNAHMRTHSGEKPHQCKYCEKRFANYTNFRNHVRIHTGEKKHKCDYCESRFIQRTSKMTHMRVIHLKIQPYQCTICSKRMSTTGQLKTHTLRHHTHEKPFECEICNKKFNANYLLTHHKLLHVNPTPYECNLCDSKYALKKSLKVHRKKKHLK